MLPRLFDTLRGQKFRNVEEHLRFYYGFSETIISFGLFSIIYLTKFDIGRYFGTSDLWALAKKIGSADFGHNAALFIREEWYLLLLAIFTFGWFLLYKRAVRREIDIVIRLFSQFNPPHDWERMVGRGWFPVFAFGLVGLFLALAWFIDRIEVYCLVVLMLNILDLRGNTVVRKNLAKHFADPAYVPTEADLHKPFIMRRRAIATEYWIDRPQLERIGTMMIFAVAALLIAVSPAVFQVHIWLELSYLVLMAAIAMNEITMMQWRKVRDQKLEEIENEQLEADRARTEESP